MKLLNLSLDGFFRMPKSPDLPTPQDNPDADVVIYDGNCNFCRDQVNRLSWWDGKKRLSFISLHDSFVSENYPDLSHDELMAQMFVIERSSSKARGGARALRYLTRKLPKLWFAAPFLHIPFTLPIWQWMYHQVAKRRYLIAGKNGNSCDNDACEIHLR